MMIETLFHGLEILDNRKDVSTHVYRIITMVVGDVVPVPSQGSEDLVRVSMGESTPVRRLFTYVITRAGPTSSSAPNQYRRLDVNIH